MTLPPDLPSLDSPGNDALIIAAIAQIDAPVVENAALRARAGDASRARRCCRGRRWHIARRAHRPQQGVLSEARVMSRVMDLRGARSMRAYNIRRVHDAGRGR
jgi:hypothetical protein